MPVRGVQTDNRVIMLRGARGNVQSYLGMAGSCHAKPSHINAKRRTTIARNFSHSDLTICALRASRSAEKGVELDGATDKGHRRATNPRTEGKACSILPRLLFFAALMSMMERRKS